MGSVHGHQLTLKLISPNQQLASAPDPDAEEGGLVSLAVSDERDPLVEHRDDIVKWDGILRLNIPQVKVNMVYIRQAVIRLRGECLEILSRPHFTEHLRNYRALNDHITNIFNFKCALLGVLQMKEDPVEKLRAYLLGLPDHAPVLRLILGMLPSHRLYSFNVERGP